MKFEKFLKVCGSRGTVVKMSDKSKFLLFGLTMVRIPEGVNVLSASEIECPSQVEDIFNEYEDDKLFKAELNDAKLHYPAAKPSELERIFANADGGDISITNKAFGIIEKCDKTYTYQEDEEADVSQDALVITYGYDDERIVGIVFADDFIIY